MNQAQAGYQSRRQNEVRNYEEEYTQLMEGVADKKALDRSPQVLEYERKNKLDRRLPDYQKMFVPKTQHDPPNLAVEDIFSRRVHEYEARNQINKTDTSSQGQSLPRVRRNF